MLAGVVSLGACSSDPQPKTLPPLQSTAASPSVSPAATVPEIPQEATERTPQGASAFASHYLAVLTDALQRAEPSTLRSLSDPGCEGCNNFIGAVEDEIAKGWTTRGGAIRVTSTATPGDQGDDVRTSVRYSRDAATILDSTGGVVKEVPADPPVDVLMRLVYRNGWTVMGIQAVEAAGS